MNEKVNRLITLASGRDCKYIGWNGAGHARIARTTLSAPDSHGGLEDHRGSTSLRELDGTWSAQIHITRDLRFDVGCAKAYRLDQL